ncbi:MAG: hypothetical protein Q4G26_05695 [Paracoccus sp. (in: a-proteobacteria)]|nr:hypothetical protein [Paracoccus sp. (in: a-proteobacteria)]
MTYNLRFRVEARKGATIRAQFKKKLAERLINPHVPFARLSGSVDRYKIGGYRRVYEVRDGSL